MADWSSRAPVDDSRRAIDPSPFVERHKCSRHRRPHVTRVHREAQPRPVERDAQDAVLADDGLADVAIPLVNARGERVASELLLGHALRRELLLDHVLRRDGGVICARKEQDLEAGHPPVARADVLQRVVERVAPCAARL